jgi:hypothetical protein
MSFVIAMFESRLIRLVLAAGCLFKSGAVMGMPMPSPGAMSGSHGTISFSGAVLMETCASAVAGEMPDTSGSVPIRGECHSGEDRTPYRFTARDIGERPVSRLLRYAKESYGKAMVLTYVYD